MSLNNDGTQYGLSQLNKVLQNWLCSKMSKCDVKWAASCYIGLR